MTVAQEFKLAGTALLANPVFMLDEICEHFVEHSEVERAGNRALLKSDEGSADIRAEEGRLLIDLTCPSPETLQMTRTMLAEHLFYFAGDDPFELAWAAPAPRGVLANLREATVVSTEVVTPRMHRLKLACADVSAFLGGDIHVRLLVPPKGREPVWPGTREDGRVDWPKGEDELLVRVYTIRAVDTARGELWIDVFQHPAPGITTPGADFARDAKPGDLVAIIGPGGGDVPQAASILLAGDETALPAIARIIAEASPGTRLKAIIEVRETQPNTSPCRHRPNCTLNGCTARTTLPTERMRWPGPPWRQSARSATNTFVWVACEKEDARRDPRASQEPGS